MRILRLFFISLALVMGVSGLSFLVIREALLTWGTLRLKQSISDVANAAASPGIYEDQCVNTFKIDLKNTENLGSFEVAFTDTTHFQFQVVCASYAFQPIVIKQYQLPPFVSKTPGSAGYVFSKMYPTSVTLNLWGRSETVVLNNNNTQVVQGTAPVTSVITPQAVCQGYGFMCCQQDASVGVGQQALGSTDCPQACFSSCVVRPVILSFNTEPFYDPQNRQLSISSGDQVSFSYATNLSDAAVKSTILSFGDGQSITTASGSGLLTHTYHCPTSGCTYQAQIEVTNQQNVSNAETAVNKVLIEVQ